MAQGITEEGFPAVLLRALFYTHSPLLIDFVRFLTRAPGYACHYPLAFRLLAQKRTPQADAFFLDFAINDDGERPELTNIMDEYFRGRDIDKDHHARGWCSLFYKLSFPIN